MIKRRITIELAFIVIFMPSITFAEPETRINTVYYMVDGDTAESIWADIIAKSPVEQNGERHVAQTRWNVGWQFWWVDSGDACEITRVTSSLDVSYTLPRLRQNPSVSDQLTARWNTYSAALFEHEQGHKDLGFRAAVEIENRIKEIGSRRSCKQLELEANEIGNSVIANYSQIEKEYDRSTNHGLNTGAVFP